MKLLLTLGVAVSFLAATSVHAQDDPLPTTDPSSPSGPAADIDPTPLPTIPPPIAFPPDLLPLPTPVPGATPSNVPTLPQLDEAFKAKPLTPVAAVYDLNLGWRKLRTRVQTDGQVKAALARAEAARTDLEKRRRLGAYYELYYSKMIAAAETPELKAYVTDRKNEYVNSLKQPRVRPEPPAKVAANPGAPTPTPIPTPAALGSPTPTPTATATSLLPSLLPSFHKNP